MDIRVLDACRLRDESDSEPPLAHQTSLILSDTPTTRSSTSRSCSTARSSRSLHRLPRVPTGERPDQRSRVHRPPLHRRGESIAAALRTGCLADSRCHRPLASYSMKPFGLAASRPARPSGRELQLRYVHSRAHPVRTGPDLNSYKRPRSTCGVTSVAPSILLIRGNRNPVGSMGR
jgi:hypothetical protein